MPLFSFKGGTSIGFRFRALTTPRSRSTIGIGAIHALEIAQEAYVNKVLAPLKKYPEWLPKYYRRSGVLIRSWHVSHNRTGGSLTTNVFNDANETMQDRYSGTGPTKRNIKYARIVYGDARGIGQLVDHAEHGWANLGAEIEKNRPLYNIAVRTIMRKSADDINRTNRGRLR